VLFAKACELFILELTHRSWIQTHFHNRKTLQRSDTAVAISKTDTFDFLIDIVPMEDIKLGKKQVSLGSSSSASNDRADLGARIIDCAVH